MKLSQGNAKSEVVSAQFEKEIVREAVHVQTELINELASEDFELLEKSLALAEFEKNAKRTGKSPL